ncbi:nephrocystin-4-like isoform X3 [Lineus longissimus]|uniref:nephrocystin-4-like isoform X3 n=1 Tax=Lineus longissimus TaxID=88925 RepID=UPI00315C9AED
MEELLNQLKARDATTDQNASASPQAGRNLKPPGSPRLSPSHSRQPSGSRSPRPPGSPSHSRQPSGSPRPPGTPYAPSQRTDSQVSIENDKKRKSITWGKDQMKMVEGQPPPSHVVHYIKMHQFPENEDRKYASGGPSFDAPFCVSLNFIVNLPDPTFLDDQDRQYRGDANKCQYQLLISLYDITYDRFFGRTWHGPPVNPKPVPGQKARLNYSQNVYFHTTINDTNICVVCELIAIQADTAGKKQIVNVGWGFFRPFKCEGDMVDTMSSTPAPTCKMDLYYGSPRALLFLEDPIENNPNLKFIDGCSLAYTIRTHKNFMKVMHLIPENVIIGPNDIVPGVVEARLDPKNPHLPVDSFRRPKAERTVPCYIDKLNIRLQPSVEAFEDELCKLLNEDRMNRDNKVADGTNVTVLERRLQVGIHNGWGYIEKPQTVHLTTEAAGKSGTASLRRGHKRTSSSASGDALSSVGLVLKNRIEIDHLVQDPMYTIVFLLEYVMTEPLNREERKMSMVRTQSLTFAVRWSAWSPFVNKSGDATLQLIGGPSSIPDGLMVYKNPSLEAGVESQEESKTKLNPGIMNFTFVNQREKLAENLNVDAGNFGRGSPTELISHESASSLHAELPGKPPVPMRDSNAELQTNVEKKRLNMQTVRQHLIQQQRSEMDAQMMMSPRGMYNPYTGMMYPPGPMGYPMPMMGSMGYQEPGSARLDLQELPYQPTHSPILALSPHIHAGQGLSRAAYARLYSVGFPTILDRGGEPPDVVDPSDHVTYRPEKEEYDQLQSNEVTLQFLAYSKMFTPTASSSKAPGTIFFTFQFYRFPQVTSERLLLGDPECELSADPKSMPCILKRLEKDSTALSGPPGYQVKYYVDPAFLKPGEGALFVKHLSQQTLHIDVWDGDSLLLIGSCAVELKHLCRQGREAVQITYELDVISTEYGAEETPNLTGDLSRSGSVRPVGVTTAVKGRLHLRLANVGFPTDKSQRTDTTAIAKKPQTVISSDMNATGFHGGSLTTTFSQLHKVKRTYKAQPLAETNHELATMLVTKHRPLQQKEEELEKMDPARRRKLARMQAVRQTDGEENEVPFSFSAYKVEKADRTRDLKTIECYRQTTKREGILNMLNQAMTTDHTLYPSMGSAEFFEYSLKNPFNVQHSVIVCVQDPDLHVVTDAREWRHYKMLNNLVTPVEEGMFNVEKTTEYPEIFLRPKEKVNIPFKFVSFKADHTIHPQTPTDPFRPAPNRPQEKSNPDSDTRVITVQFLTKDGKLMSQLNLRIAPQPHVIDQTFRFYHPEQAFLKKSIRLPPFHTIPGAPVGGAGFSQLYIRCSDPNVICEAKNTQSGEPQDVFLKVACGPSPQIKKFFMAIYTDLFLSKPIQIWQFFIHSLQRVDVTCTEGQTSRFSLILRGTQASRLAACYSSHPKELQIAPKDSFMLAANTVHELNVAVRPLQVGSKYMFLNVVDVEFHQLIRTWLICLSCKAPVVSKAFELQIPIGGGKGSNKRITYTNPYPTRKTFNLTTNRDDLLQFKEARIEIAAGDTYTIGLRFTPSMMPGAASILIFINDDEGKNEETFCVKAQYA